MKKKISRRHLLGGAAGLMAISPFDMLFKGILEGVIGKTYAQELGISPRNYIFISIPGAPHRWGWDPLTAFDDPAKMVFNKGVTTKLIADSNDKYTLGEYATTFVKGARMPWMWQFDIPTPTGKAPMSNLMDSMLSIMGINVANPQHPGAQALQHYPLGIPYSLSSYPADISKAPIPHLGLDALANSFKSKTGSAALYVRTNNNILNQIMDPFKISQTSQFVLNKNLIDAEIKKSMQSMDDFAKSMNPAANSFALNKKGAEEIIKSSYGDLTTVYADLSQKYQSLIDLAKDPITNPLAGLSDKMVGPDMSILNSIKSSQINRMAGQFAVTEFMILNNLTQSMNFATGPIAGFNFDSHSIDHIKDAVATAFWNRAVAACLYELISRLKNKGIYNDTVIQINGEFNRNPRNDGTGCDHGYENASVTYFSGAIDGLQAIGNTRIDSPRGGSNGSYGQMANNDGYGILNLGHQAASLATMLRTKSAVTAAPTLLEETKQGKIIAKLPPSKLVVS